MSAVAGRSARWAQRGVGAALGVAVLTYMVLVTLRGGFLFNPNRPQDVESEYRLIERFQAKTQNAARLFKRSTNPPTSVAKYLRRAQENGIQLVRDRIELHRSLAYGKAQQPEGYSTDLAAFRSVDYARIPAEYKAWIDTAAFKTILYKSTFVYETLGASQDPPETVYRRFLEKLVSLEWTVGNLLYDTALKRGIISAHRGNWHAAIAVLNESTFPDSHSTIFWRLDCLDSEEEDANRFLDILYIAVDVDLD